MVTKLIVPSTPSRGVLWSMALRYRHDFGIDKDPEDGFSSGCTFEERESILKLMAKLYEEATGQGFYKHP